MRCNVLNSAGMLQNISRRLLNITVLSAADGFGVLLLNNEHTWTFSALDEKVYA